MICNVLVQDCRVYQILTVFGVLTWTVLMCKFLGGCETDITDTLTGVAVPWGTSRSRAS